MSPFLADRKRLTVIDTVGDDHRTLTRIVAPWCHDGLPEAAAGRLP
jgi:hypothetical protein